MGHRPRLGLLVEHERLEWQAGCAMQRLLDLTPAPAGLGEDLSVLGTDEQRVVLLLLRLVAGVGAAADEPEAGADLGHVGGGGGEDLDEALGRGRLEGRQLAHARTEVDRDRAPLLPQGPPQRVGAPGALPLVLGAAEAGLERPAGGVPVAYGAI